MSTTITSEGPASTMPGLRRAPRAAYVAAWLTAVASLLLVAASLVLDVTGPDHGPGADLAEGYGVTYAVGGLAIALCALLVTRDDPRQRFGWALLPIAAVWVLDGFSQSYVRVSISADGIDPGANLALWFLNRFGSVLPLSIALLLLIFPTGRFLPGWLGRLGIAALGGMVVAAALVVLTPATNAPDVAHLPPEVDLNYLTLSPLASADGLRPVTGVLTIAGFLFAMVSAVLRYRRSTAADRDRMRWLIWAVLVMALTLTAVGLLDLGSAVDAVIVAVAVLPVAAMTVGVVRPTVVPVEDLLVRTLVLGAVALSLLGVDLLVVALLSHALGDLGQRQLVTVVLLVTALAYGPLRQRLSRLVQGWVLGSRGNRYDVMAGLAASLESIEDGPAQLAAVAQAVADAFGIGYVAVEVDRPGGERLTATYGDRPTQTRMLPITYREAEVGRLVLPARGMRSRLSSRDEKLLGDLVRQAATAARTSRLADELQAIRERLVTTREEERRRIRRDLHDGLGPAMAGVVYQLETARLLVSSDPDGATAQIDTVRDHVQEIVADVRRLVHELRPPALDDRGLVGAVRQLAEHQQLPVSVEAADLGTLSAAVEVAAYRIVAESLTNVARHAQAGSARVRLERTGTELVVEIADDGVGIGADVQAGVGLLSVRERAAELGGHTEVSCPPSGGTVVRAVLPLGVNGKDGA
ncbi:sensor histidine kinase [Nocardioides pocheonensis]|uniref:histidine kinase n=1 Tax=Nocardioides pocheonensis TaxID=661485 RepID=A0A3N0GW07_9ACTN|nr:sensor histidine kinase [Nocardioides pocheonensis]RNM16330.1 sensor histidine kinase [Nocardioides pocheonensis]